MKISPRIPNASPSITGMKPGPIAAGFPTSYCNAIVASKTPQVASIEFKPSNGGAAFKTIRRVTIADSYGYFTAHVTFPSSGSVRIAWSGPGGRLFYSRIAPVTIE